MEEQKQSGVPTEEQLAQINQFTRKQLSADEVYVFSLTLCDNEIDRDYERFTVGALQELSKLFVGRTGIFDHSMKTRDQCARIFHCEVVKGEGSVTKAGEPYYALKAYAYMPRGGTFDSMIAQIESGIKKEVSVSCTMQKRLCSVCGADQNEAPCGHMRGKYYGTGSARKQCHVVLDMPSDAYEWSFVAVPAQPKAGVTKSFVSDGISALSAADEEVQQLVQSLKAKAEAGERYAELLKADAVKYSLLANPALEQKTITRLVEAMELDSLEAFVGECKAAACKRLPLQPQLAPAAVTETALDTNYLI